MTETSPLIVIYVAWHPEFAEGKAIADMLHDHYRRNLLTNVSGGTGLSVVFRSAPAPGAAVPPAIDLDDAATTAVVALLDASVINDAAWVAWLQELARQTEEKGLRTRLFPVSIDASALSIGGDVGDINFVRWDTWFGDPVADRYRKLVFQLTYQFARMLRAYLAWLDHPNATKEEELDEFLTQVKVFLSHSKHDKNEGKEKYGEQIALAFRASIDADMDLKGFFDARNIPPGVSFKQVLERNVRTSAVVAIHTDSYASREWCRREILEAKRYNVPLVVANCVVDFEDRGFPYLGNVPVIRMEHDAKHRIGIVIARLLEEVLKDYLWRCRAKLASAPADVMFLPRPPELISLAEIVRKGVGQGTIVYPDPPLGAEEADLFAAIGKGFQLRSFTQWLAEQP
jgi:hypothetical protein